ncbi:hypothetical protein GGR51DRAFT_554321 [Nemania sp. FL0031]|nr:hypothetical protein GGR51DRAFT_554321 [Nemania sp. FL0031]
MEVDEDSIGQEVDNSISYLTVKCADLFATSQSIPALCKDNWAGKRLADFNIWAASIAASSESYASLDHRLRDRNDLKAVIVGLLKDIKSCLERFFSADISQAAASDSEGPSSDSEDQEDIPWSDYSSDTDRSSEASADTGANGPLAAETKKISLTIDQLYRISLLTHRYGTNYHSYERHLKDGWQEMAARVADSSQLDHVQKRLIWANVMRRNRIYYATRTPTDKDAELPQADSSRKQPGLLPSPHEGAEVTSQQEEGDREKSAAGNMSGREPQPSRPVETVSQAGDESLGEEGKKESAPTESSFKLLKPSNVRWTAGTPTQATDLTDTRDYPRPPGDGKNIFSCPFCGEQLSAGCAKDPKRWRAHAQEDLAPYTCVFPDCSTPYELYVQKSEWRSHIQNMHRTPVLICDMCPPGPESIHIGSFSSSELWEQHTRTTHKDAFPLEQLSSIASLCRKLCLQPIACPLCGHKEPFETKAFSHIAAHLHDFALRALPWAGSSREADGSYDLSLGLDDTSRAHDGHTGEAHSVDEAERTVDEEEFTPRGLEVLQEAIAAILNLLPDVQQYQLSEFAILKTDITLLQQQDFNEMSDEDIDTYTRPLLRIQQILSGADDSLMASPEQVEELKQSLLEEHESLLKLDGKNEDHLPVDDAEMLF